MSELTLSPRDRLVYALAHATGTAPLCERLWSVSLVEPGVVHRALTDCLGETRTVVVTGTVDRRLVLIEHEVGGSWTVADLSVQAQLLVSLYHPEYFPLPRFPLAISTWPVRRGRRFWALWS